MRHLRAGAFGWRLMMFGLSVFDRHLRLFVGIVPVTNPAKLWSRSIGAFRVLARQTFRLPIIRLAIGAVGRGRVPIVLKPRL
jgi:hypothetical protein